jgi:outer membrane protein OmpA-like peptidoglycan-associated protein
MYGMKIPWWLVLLIFAGYSWWAVNRWHCYKCQCCAGATPAAAADAAVGAPLFAWGAAKPLLDSLRFKDWKNKLLDKGGQGDTLLITGLYRTAEKPSDPAVSDLGLARATALRALMMPEMPESRVRLSSKLASDDWAEGAAPRESAAFSWLKMVLKKEEGAIIESDNAVTFLFPFNSTEKDRDPAVDAYLKKLTDKHRNSSTTFSIVGYTDDVGTPEENLALGLGRAKSIEKILTGMGIRAERIKAESKGEAEPVADNASEDGRHQNRRVVLTVNQ